VLSAVGYGVARVADPFPLYQRSGAHNFLTLRTPEQEVSPGEDYFISLAPFTASTIY